MVTKHSVDEQLKKIQFNLHGWGRTEINELPSVLLPEEEIYECVNGLYEGGFALLVATDLRLLLIDKKPLNYLTVEDMRFDMINEIDYSHRMIGANISISTGYKDLKFTSFNQHRLRKLIGHVQHCMAESKKKQSEHQEDQRLHLEQINQQLQTYLLAQHQQQQKMQEQLRTGGQAAEIKPVRPDNELSDYLYAQSLLAQHQQQTGQAPVPDAVQSDAPEAPASQPPAAELYAEGVQEVFGKQPQAAVPAPLQFAGQAVQHALEINPLRIARSRLPMTMRNNNRRLNGPPLSAETR
jgi:hypothetical protein